MIFNIWNFTLIVINISVVPFCMIFYELNISLLCLSIGISDFIFSACVSKKLQISWFPFSFLFFNQTSRIKNRQYALFAKGIFGPLLTHPIVFCFFRSGTYIPIFLLPGKPDLSLKASIIRVFQTRWNEYLQVISCSNKKLEQLEDVLQQSKRVSKWDKNYIHHKI